MASTGTVSPPDARRFDEIAAGVGAQPVPALPPAL